MAEIARPIDRIRHILGNYRDRYLADSDNFPGGCVFVNLTVELSGRRSHLADAVNEGFVGFKSMLTRLLEKERAAGRLKDRARIGEVVQMIFSGLPGTCAMYTADKSNLNLTIGALVADLEGIGA